VLFHSIACVPADSYASMWTVPVGMLTECPPVDVPMGWLTDGKRVEHKTAVGLVRDVGPGEKDAWQEVDRQRLRANANQYQPFRGNPTTYGQLCQHYMQNELQEDQSEATIEKAYTTAETYKRILNKRVIPRFGRKSPLAIEPLEVEKWLREVKKAQSLENPTLDKIRRVMNLVYKHGQR
jgi:Phage integrase, N-terminal SAM-like domain